MRSNRILILGIGNILLKDEGVGVRVIEKIAEEYDLPPDIDLVDGGTLGLQLLGTLADADFVIAVDAVKNGKAPGTLYRFSATDVPSQIAFKDSVHQVDLLEALRLTKTMGNTPDVVIIGVEPEDISPFGMELTPAIKDKVPDLVELVLDEIGRIDVRLKPEKKMGSGL